MSTAELKKEPVIEVQMLVRKPAAVVYHAFVDPAVTTNFWFTKSSGTLEKGATVTWEWEMYSVSAKVTVQEMLKDEKIVFTWGSPATTVEIIFQAQDKMTTYVVIRNYGFVLEGDALIRAVNDNTGGFTTVIDGLKAWLEHGIRLNLIADKFPAKPQH
jgi:uncharacterized protein YndB with AHSA1/START domain